MRKHCNLALWLSGLFVLFLNIGHAQQKPTILKKLNLDLSGTQVTEEELEFCLSLSGIQIQEIDLDQLQYTLKIVEEVIQEIERRKSLGLPIIVDTVAVEPINPNVKPKNSTAAPPPKWWYYPRRWIHAGRTVVNNNFGPDEETPEFIFEVPMDSLSKPKRANIYGQHIFQDRTMYLFEADSTAKPPDTYLLGPGDVITISIFGVSQTDLRFTINEEGFIKPENMPRIFLEGVPYGKAKKLLRERFRQAYIFLPEQFSASLTEMRQITVHIFGEVINSGSYTISALNTALNAIVATGGYEPNGDVRKVQLVRNGQIQLIDIYEFLLNPSIQYNFQLENNDIIFIPVVEKVVKVKGAIIRPHKYALIEGEELQDLIEYAGGLKKNAYTGNIQINRFVDNEYVQLNVNYKELLANQENFPLLNGDEIIIDEVKDNLEKTVVVTGAVMKAGSYGWEQNMRISDLVEKAVLKPDAQLEVGYLLRKNLDQTSTLKRLSLSQIINNSNNSKDLLLQPGDKLIIFKQAQFADQAEVKVTGAVREKTQIAFDVSKKMTVQDLILLGGGLQPNAASIGYIKRTSTTNRNIIDYVRVDLAIAMQNFEAPENLILEPNDHLMVFTQERFSELYKVKIEGAIREPGEFDYDDEMRVKDLIYLAGGLSDQALDTGYIVRTDLENQKQVEYISINFQLAVNIPGTSENRLLQPMDKLIILNKPNYYDQFPVKVMGAVRHPGEVQFSPSLNIRDLITLAGGLSYEADSTHLDIYRLDMNAMRDEEDIPSRHYVQTIKIDAQYNVIPDIPLDFQLQPYDHVIIRKIPGFELQRVVKIEGEVKYPGYYVITKLNERLSDIIKEAGGYTKEAYPKGASLYRSDEVEGYVVLELHKATKSQGSHENIVLKDGDVIQIPKKEDLVYIKVQGTRAKEIFPEKYVDSEGLISLPFQGRKSARWYINQYAGGFFQSCKTQ